jgi:hypothetical protein
MLLYQSVDKPSAPSTAFKVETQAISLSAFPFATPETVFHFPTPPKPAGW